MEHRNSQLFFNVIESVPLAHGPPFDPQHRLSTCPFVNAENAIDFPHHPQPIINNITHKTDRVPSRFSYNASDLSHKVEAFFVADDDNDAENINQSHDDPCPSSENETSSSGDEYITCNSLSSKHSSKYPKIAEPSDLSKDAISPKTVSSLYTSKPHQGSIFYATAPNPNLPALHTHSQQILTKTPPNSNHQQSTMLLNASSSLKRRHHENDVNTHSSNKSSSCLDELVHECDEMVKLMDEYDQDIKSKESGFNCDIERCDQNKMASLGGTLMQLSGSSSSEENQHGSLPNEELNANIGLLHVLILVGILRERGFDL